MRQKQTIFFLALTFLASSAFGQSVKLGKNPAKDLRIEIFYDNYVAVEGTEADWGFSCALDINGEQILFDTGTLPKVLTGNIVKLSYDLSQIDAIVISHDHMDHIGGLKTILEKLSERKVYLPDGADKQLNTLIVEAGGKAEANPHAKEIAKNVWLSGTMGQEIREQCLVINHEKGLMVLTGCSHPGIVEMLESIRNRFGKNIYAVMGGFHLMQHSKGQIEEIINGLKALGITQCGCTHCTGDRQIQWFREAFGEAFLEMGTGREVVF